MGAERGDRELTKLDLRYAGYEVVDPVGAKIGTVEAAFLDEGDQREYVAVRRGLAGLIPGTGSSIIPMAVADRVDHNRSTIEVSVDKDTVKDSPSVNTMKGLTSEQAAQVRGYYRL